MRKLVLTIPELVFIAATRGALGFGAGLLLADKLSESRRRALGLSLVAIGVATTIPAARKVFGGRTEIAPLNDHVEEEAQFMLFPRTAEQRSR
jgi:hypothetical protein